MLKLMCDRLNAPALAALLLACFWSQTSPAAEMPVGEKFEITVEAGKADRSETPVKFAIEVAAAQAKVSWAQLTGANGDKLVAQVCHPSLTEADRTGENARTLHFILPSLKAGEKATYSVQLMATPYSGEMFHWKHEENKFAELDYGQQPVLKYMCTPLDDSSPEAREQTYKVFHHLYSPSGDTVVTKGPGGRYTHHRGLFYGFNRISYDGEKTADTWHCRGDAHLSHEKFVSEEAGPILGRHQVEIAWHGPGKEVFAVEHREMTVYHLPSGVLVEFASVLESKAGKVRLDGDPQHAGFQFRAADEVASKTNKQTYYLRPDGRGEMGATRNWVPKNPDPKTVNLPWNAMSFVLGDQRYTTVYLDHPRNPKEARYSERDYGRFGSYFEYDLDESNPLKLNYRVWLNTGEIEGDKATSLRADFVEPVNVTVSA